MGISSWLDMLPMGHSESKPKGRDGTEAEEQALKLLLIEDHRSDALLLEKSLKKYAAENSFALTHVTRLSDGLEELKIRKYDAIILDLTLPDSQGLNSIESLRVHFPFLPIIVLTGMNDERMGIAAMQAGAQDYFEKTSSYNGDRILKAIKYAIERQYLLLEVHTEKSRHQHSADHDPLTALPNRNLFRDRLLRAISLGRRDSKQLAVIFLDLDGFKEVNDAFGHLIGDKLLRAVSARFQQRIRETDTVARIGGDEFLFFFYDVKSTSDAGLLAKKLVKVFEEPFQIDGDKFQLSASLGISLFPQDAEQMEELISCADSAMYRAKELGKNQYRFHSPMLNIQQRAVSVQVKALAEAMDRGEIEIFYQPCIDLETRKIVSVQALPRWNHPNLGFMEARDFVPLAEESGLILALNTWIMQSAAEQLKAWHKAGHSSLSLSLNLSKMQMQAKDLQKSIAHDLAHFDLNPKFVHFEVTEADVNRAMTKNLAVLRSIREIGAKITLDGLGTGLFSIGNLKSFPLDFAKIDRSLVAQMMTHGHVKGLMVALIEILKSLGVKTIAEGVEHEVQAELLREMHCDLAQGYVFGRPVSVKNMDAVLNSEPNHDQRKGIL